MNQSQESGENVNKNKNDLSTITNSFPNSMTRDTSSSIIANQSNLPSSLLYTSSNLQQQQQQQTVARVSASSGIHQCGIFTEQPPPEFFQRVNNRNHNSNKRASISSELSLPLYSFEKSQNWSKNNNSNNHNNSTNSFNTSLSNSQSVTPLANNNNNNNVATSSNNMNNNNTPNLYVSNLSVGVTNDLLTSWFRAYGPLISACVMVDVQTGRSRGYGFVQFENETDSETALNELNGKSMQVPASNSNEDDDEQQQQQPTTSITVRVQKSMHHKGIPAAPSRTVFLRNIPISYDVEALTTILSKFGQVERIQLFPIFENPKLVKASINFATTEAALAAVNALHRKMLDPGCDVALAARFGESSKKMTAEAAALATASHVTHATSHHQHHQQHQHHRQFSGNANSDNNNNNYPIVQQSYQASHYSVPMHQQQMALMNNSNNNIPVTTTPVLHLQHQHQFVPQHHFHHHHHNVQQHMMMQNNNFNNNNVQSYQPQSDMAMVLVQMIPGQPPVLVPASQIGCINNQNNYNNNNGMVMMMLPVNTGGQNQATHTNNVVVAVQQPQQFM